MLFNYNQSLSTTHAFVCMQNVFSADECNAIIHLSKKYPLEDLKIVGSAKEHKDSGDVNSTIRKSKGIFFDYFIHQETHWIFEKLMGASNYINDNYFQFDLKGFYSVQYTEYDDKMSHYDWHTDLTLNGDSDYTFTRQSRKLSASLILSNPQEYSGGEFWIERHPDGSPANVIEQNQGSIIFFPSFVVHKVTPVTKGIRRSMVYWLEGPKFK